MKQYLYEDPTGGGDDITLTAPDWIDSPPSNLTVYQGNDRHVFEFAGEQEMEE